MNGINLTGRIDLNATLLRERISDLGDRIATGRKGNSYAALKTDAPKSIDLRAEITRREAYQNTIDQTLAKIEITQDVLNRIGAIAERFAASTVKLMGAAKPEEIQIQAGAAKAAPAPATPAPVRKSRRFMKNPQTQGITMSHETDKSMVAKDGLKAYSITILGKARAAPPPSRLCITPWAMDL
jgi:hypothetical protein